MSPDNLLRIWLDGWKKTFTLRGRSSRFELWTFLLVNSVLTVIIQLKCSYILSPRFLRAANDMGYSLPKIENYILAAETLFTSSSCCRCSLSARCSSAVCTT